MNSMYPHNNLTNLEKIVLALVLYNKDDNDKLYQFNSQNGEYNLTTLGENYLKKYYIWESHYKLPLYQFSYFKALKQVQNLSYRINECAKDYATRLKEQKLVNCDDLIINETNNDALFTFLGLSKKLKEDSEEIKAILFINNINKPKILEK